MHLGTYVTEQEAAVAFDRAALIVRGKHCCLAGNCLLTSLNLSF